MSVSYINRRCIPSDLLSICYEHYSSSSSSGGTSNGRPTIYCEGKAEFYPLYRKGVYLNPCKMSCFLAKEKSPTINSQTMPFVNHR